MPADTASPLTVAINRLSAYAGGATAHRVWNHVGESDESREDCAAVLYELESLRAQLATARACADDAIKALQSEIATARATAFAEGIEAAARYVEGETIASANTSTTQNWNDDMDAIAAAIRALSPAAAPREEKE